MKNVKFLVSCMVLSMVALLYVVSYAQTTTSASDDKKACCAKMTGGENMSCENCPCCKDGACKDKDKHSSHAAGMKDGCCKMKGEKAGNAAEAGDKTEGCCGCCAGDACKDMKNKKETASGSQNGDSKESGCGGGCCKMKKASN